MNTGGKEAETQTKIFGASYTVGIGKQQQERNIVPRIVRRSGAHEPKDELIGLTPPTGINDHSWTHLTFKCQRFLTQLAVMLLQHSEEVQLLFTFHQTIKPDRTPSSPAMREGWRSATTSVARLKISPGGQPLNFASFVAPSESSTVIIGRVNELHSLLTDVR